MSNKCCILNSGNTCDECGECYTCDLDRNKTCNSCGKCLEENIDMRSVKVDEIIEEEYSEDEYFKDDDFEGGKEGESSDEFEFEFIDDIEGLSDILEDDKKRDEYTYEEYPGLIRFKRGK